VSRSYCFVFTLVQVVHQSVPGFWPSISGESISVCELFTIDEARADLAGDGIAGSVRRAGSRRSAHDPLVRSKAERIFGLQLAANRESRSNWRSA
jgi:hypothetical protein